MLNVGTEPNQAELLRIAAEELRKRLPDAWTVYMRPEEPGSDKKALDGILQLTAPDGRMAQLPVEAKPILNARDVPRVIDELKGARFPGADLVPPFVIARYLTPRTRNALAERGASYADATGNVRLDLADPAVFVESAGAEADPWRGPERVTRTLQGKPASKIVRTLVDFSPPFRIRQLAKDAGTSPASASRAVDFLEREALAKRDSDGSVVTVDWPGLLRRWSEDYDLQRSNRVVAGFDPRGPQAARSRLKDSPRRYAITGSAAAALRAPYADTKLLPVYTDEPEDVARDLMLRLDAPSSNVWLIEPMDPFVYERSEEAEDGLNYVAPSQAVVDLLTSPGRGPAEGEELLEWMEKNERAWRK